MTPKATAKKGAVRSAASSAFGQKARIPVPSGRQYQVASGHPAHTAPSPRSFTQSPCTGTATCARQIRLPGSLSETLALFRRIAMLAGMTPEPARRIALVDAARTAALAGMAAFHLTFDLEMFGHLPPGTVAYPGPWAMFARLVAGSFLFLAGVSLFLAHGNGIRWNAFLRRLAVLIAAAFAISAGTWVLMPDRFIYFGILHAIAACSLAGLLFLHLPASLTLAVAAAVFALPWFWTSPAFQSPWLLWLGLAPVPRPSMDFEPFFPWFAPFLAGMALAKAARVSAFWPVISQPPGPLLHRLAWPGRHSLALYLIHQPVLIGLVWTWTQLAA
jgi:uncharacterized membrane protein